MAAMALDLQEDVDYGEIETGLSNFKRKPLAGKIVEIYGMQGQKVKTCESRVQDRVAVSVDGQRGQVIGWNDDEERYIVHTFDGLTVSVEDRYLLESTLPAPESGGSDVVYPIGGSAQEFGKAIADWLAVKGYCMIQMSENKQTRLEAYDVLEEAGVGMQASFRQEFESAYLGINNNTRVKALPEEQGDDAGSALTTLSHQMSSTLNALSLFTEEYFGHSCWATSSTWARISDVDDDVDDSAAITENDVSRKSLVDAYERFLQGRKACALYMVENDGGDIQLFPRTGSDLQSAGIEAVTIPITANKMLIFRHDEMGYAYHPKGPSMALQSWMLSDIPIAQRNTQIEPLTGVKDSPGGANAQVMSLDTKFPGQSTSMEKFWLMFCTGTDCGCQWPSSRWETEPYYTDKGDWTQVGKAYTMHGSFCNEIDFISFDNKFFGIEEAEADIMSCGQRHVLDTGYTACYRAGYRRATLKGENIGTYLGDVGMDWHLSHVPWTQGFFGRVSQTTMNLATHHGMTAARISHIFDLNGPTQTADTACSASLVALQAGHKAMMHNATDTNKSSSISRCNAIISGGTNQMLNPYSFIGNCAAGMLSHVGRCWTFDRTADGYARGEGAGCMFIKWSGDKVDMEERLACLVGTCTGHDGRSASLTAPNGPAQQDAIRRSMRMAGVDPSLISVCECHGTGTALGDPIEIGSLQGVMRGRREFPLLNTSAKTNISHLEACAGGAGIMKCVMMVSSATGPPNCHLRVVNPNLITEGYPVFFQQELCDTSFSTTFIGVSSFGFGGTNSRADVYGRALRGSRNTGNLWTEERTRTRALALANGLRGGLKLYESLDPAVTAKAPIYIMGSWDDYAQMSKMECTEPGVFTCRITLGDMRKERFKLLYDGRKDKVIYPATADSGSSALIVGPGTFHENDPGGNQWLIDGRQDAVPAGTQYLITFKWQGAKTMSWAVQKDLALTSAVDQVAQVFNYYILSSGKRFQPLPMTCISEIDGLYEADLQLNSSGEASFNLQRGKDTSQGIYLDDSGVIQDPGAMQGDQRRFFRANGDSFGTMKVQLSVINGIVEVSVSSAEGVAYSWRNESPFLFYVSGSFNDWKQVRMSENEDIQGMYFYHVVVPDDEPVEYRIEVEGQWKDGLVGVSSYVPGADAKVMDAVRDFKGNVGSAWEIIVDLNQDDPNRVIYHRPATHVEAHKL